MKQTNYVASFFAFVLTFVAMFIFNRIFYVTLTATLMLLFFQNHWMLHWLLMGLLAASLLSNLDGTRQKLAIEKLIKIKFKWYHYIPFFVFDAIVWPYSVLGITGDILFGQMEKDMEKYGK